MSKQPRKPPDPDLLARLWHNMVLGWRLIFDRRVSSNAKLIPLLTLFYILSPIDLIPDILVPFGVMDDISALLIGLQLFIRSAPQYVVDEYRGVAPRKEPGSYTPPEQAQIIDGDYEVHELDEHSG